jgi:hypothetical protein
MGAAGVTDSSYNELLYFVPFSRAGNSFVTFSRAGQEAFRFFTVKFCLCSFLAPAQYRRSDIESHGVSSGSVSTPKMKSPHAGAQKKGIRS